MHMDVSADDGHCCSLQFILGKELENRRDLIISRNARCLDNPYCNQNMQESTVYLKCKLTRCFYALYFLLPLTFQGTVTEEKSH